MDTFGTHRSDFLASIVVEHGPRNILARYFLAISWYLRERRLHLELISFPDLLDVNRRNRESWLPLTPTFDVTVNADLTRCPAYVFAARTESGDVVATHASRLFNWERTSFHFEAETLRLFYADPTRQAVSQESCRVSAPSAKQIRGNVVYSGATWYHPSVRGLGLPGVLSPFNRAYALSQWPVDTFTGLVSEANVNRNFAQRAHHANWEHGVLCRCSTHGDVDYYLVWSTPDAVVAGCESFITTNSNPLVAIDQRSA